MLTSLGALRAGHVLPVGVVEDVRSGVQVPRVLGVRQRIRDTRVADVPGPKD